MRIGDYWTLATAAAAGAFLTWLCYGLRPHGEPTWLVVALLIVTAVGAVSRLHSRLQNKSGK